MNGSTTSLAELLQFCQSIEKLLRRDYSRIVQAKNGERARKAYDDFIVKWKRSARLW